MFKEELAIVLLSTFGLASIPAFFIFLDYHKRSNIHKAVLFVLSLFTAGWLVAILPARVLLTVALFTPVMVMAYVVIAKRR